MKRYGWILWVLCLTTLQAAELEMTWLPDRLAFLPGESIRFNGAFSDQSVPINFSWQFGDGQSATGVEANHAFTMPGRYQIKLQGVRNDGVAVTPRYLTVTVFQPEDSLPPDRWDERAAAAFASPVEALIVAEAGTTLEFEAEALIPASDFFWQVIGFDITHTGSTWRWQVPADWDDVFVTVFLNAIGPDGTPEPFGRQKDLYIYQTTPPPNAWVVAPNMDSDGVFRTRVGETLTFRADGEAAEGRGPLTYSWEMLGTGSLNGSTCNGSTELLGQGASLDFSPTEAGMYCLRLRGTDQAGVDDPFPAQFQVQVKGENREPSGVIVTPSQVVTIGETIDFRAEGSDPDGDLLTFQWTFGDGTTEVGTQVSKTFGQAGATRVSLVASDGTSSDKSAFERWILVNDPDANPVNNPPFVTLLFPVDGETFLQEMPVQFSGYGYDNDDDSLRFFADFDDGTLHEGEADFEKTYQQLGKFEPRYFVVDDKNHFTPSFDPVRLLIYEDSAPPDGLILSPALDLEDGPGYDPDVSFIKTGGNLSFVGRLNGLDDTQGYGAFWVITDQTGFYQVLEGFSVNAVFSKAGFYDIAFHVADPNGLMDPFPDTRQVSVEDNFQPEGHIIEPAFDLMLDLSQHLTLSAEGEDLDGDELTFLWKISDGRELDGPRHEFVRFAEAGLFTITLEISDIAGSTVKAPEIIYVNVFEEGFFDDKESVYIQPISPTPSRVSGPEGSSFMFQAEGRTPDPTVAGDFFWDFGNGKTATGASPGLVTFDEAGFYLVRAYFTSEAGVRVMYPEYWDVFIYGNNVPPMGTITEPPLREADNPYDAATIPVLMGQSVTFKAEAIDQDGDLPLSIAWFKDGEQFSTSLTPDPLTFEEQGIYDIYFAVCDSEGLCNPQNDSRLIKVVDPSLPPESFIHDPVDEIVVEPGEEVWFFGYGEDPNELDLTFEWEFGETASPQRAQGYDIYPVVFQNETPPDQPIVVTFRAKTQFTEDPTPATVKVHVRRYQDEDFEPNNDFSQAAKIVQGNYAGLSLGDGDDADFFLFDILENDRDLKIEFVSDQKVIAELYRFENGEWVKVPNRMEGANKNTLSVQDLIPGRYALNIVPENPGKFRKAGLNYGMRVAVAQPTLYLPFLVEDGSLSSVMGLVNPFDEAVDIAVVGIDGNGESLTTVSKTLPARGRLEVNVLDFFGKSEQISNGRRLRWAKVFSSRRLVGFTKAETQDKSQLMGAGALQALSSSVLAPHIAVNTQTWYTRATVINASETNHELAFRDFGGTRKLGEPLANSQTDIRFKETFGDNLPAWGEFVDTDGQSRLAGIEIFGRIDGAKQMAALEMIPSQRYNPNFTFFENDLYFTHVAKDRVNFWTGLALVNTSEADVGYSLIAYDDSGTEVRRLANQSLLPGQKLVSTVADLLGTDTEVSWIKVEADQGLSGFELFGDHGGTRMAGFPAADYAVNRLFFPFLDMQAGKTWTGVALLNLSDEVTTVELEVRDSGGALIANTTRELEPRTKLVALPRDLFPNVTLPETGSYLEVRGNRKALNGFQLFGTLNDKGGLGEQMAGFPAQIR